jgi:uncharacterized protein with GYD domain
MSASIINLVHLTAFPGIDFWTLGAFDGVLIFEAADEETATAAVLQLGSLGNVQTQTGRAFNTAEMEKILAQTK